MSSPLTLSQVAQQSPGYLNAEVQATVLEIVPKKSNKTGKPFWVCKLGEATGPTTMELAIFTGPKFSVGQAVLFSGQGIKFSSDNYGQKLSVSDKTIITIMGHSAHHEEQQERRAFSEPSVNGQTQPVPGQTVGMAIKEALGLLTKDLTHDEIVARVIAPCFWASVHEVSSDIIRISRYLEAGKLAPSVKDRTERSPQPAAYFDRTPAPDDLPF